MLGWHAKIITYQLQSILTLDPCQSLIMVETFSFKMVFIQFNNFLDQT